MAADPRYYRADGGYVWEERFADPLDDGVCIAEDLKPEDAISTADLMNYAYLKAYIEGARAEHYAEIERRKQAEVSKKKGE